MAKRSHQRPLVGFDEPEQQPQSAAGQTVDACESSVVIADGTIPAELSPDAPLAGRTVYLVDAHSLIYQVFHALPEMTGPTGQPVGAVQGFIRDLVDLIEIRRADYVIVAFDHPGPNFRHQLYDQYKIHRAAMPADLQLQIPVIQEFVRALGLPLLSVPGFEADDILATVAAQVDAAGAECYVVTSDKDCRQLITDRVKLLNIRKGEVFDAVSLQAVWGIRPDQVIDFQSLVGDSVDNVPGVPLIGPKIAQELLSKYDTLEGVFAHTHEIAGAKRKENLTHFQHVAFESRELVKLRTDVTLTVDWPTAGVGQFHGERLAALCRDCGFKQLARRLETLAKGTTSAGSSSEKPRAASDLPPDGAPVELMPAEPLTAADSPAWNATYKTIATLDELTRLAMQAAEQPRLSIDTETTSLLPRWAEIVGYSLAWKVGEAYYIPVKAPAGEPQFEAEVVREALRPVLENPAVAKIGQNLKYDVVVLRSAGIELRGLGFDTMVADYLLDPGERTHNMDDLARRHLQHQTITIDQLIGTGKNQKRMDEVPLALITQYAAEDADVPLRLASVLEPRLAREGLAELFTGLEMPLIAVLAELEFNGIRVDVLRLQELSGQFAERIAQLEREIYEIAGREFNIDSRLQLAQLLFEEFKLPILKKTKTGPSMDAEVLEELAALHALPAKVIEYRQNAKLKSTYVDALQQLVHPTTGRVHTSFKQDVAATGRLSSQDPNLQNIPIRTEQGRAIRSAFLPGPEGWLLMTADYSQIELRVLAHFSGDETLRQAFIDDRDVHTQVASEVYGVPLDEVTPAQRRNAKTVNFGVIYGQSPFGLAKTLRIDQREAADFIQRYFARYPGVDDFMIRTLQQCRRDGFVSTILGRRRPVSGVRDPALLADPRQRSLPERIAINTVIQGSAADIIKRAMINVHRRLQAEALQSKMLLQIHDELVFEFPPAERDRLTALVAAEMSSAAELSVPLKVDIKTGPNWAACE
ncbi:MAG: DNA polymerase I [Pirellulaceae bacterium]